MFKESTIKCNIPSNTETSAKPHIDSEIINITH